MSYRQKPDACIAFIADVGPDGSVKYRHTVTTGSPAMEWNGCGWNEETGRWYEDLVPMHLDGAIMLRADLDLETKRRMMQGLFDYAMSHLEDAQAKAREYIRNGMTG